MNASWPQTKTIWSIIIKAKAESYTGPATDPQFWKKLSDDSKLDRTQASSIISAFIAKDGALFDRLVVSFDPGFKMDQARFDAAGDGSPRRASSQPRPSRPRKTRRPTPMRSASVTGSSTSGPVTTPG
jgi:hypothetical protein